MNTYLNKFAKKYNYPEESVDVLLSSYEVLKDDEEFNLLLNSFYGKTNITLEQLSDTLSKISESKSVNLYTTQFVFLVCLTRELKKEYKKANIEEEVYFDTVNDILYKLKECYEIEKVWGIIPLGWFYSMFHMKILAFGRLQYAIGKMWHNTTVAGKTINSGDDVVYIHIPSSGKPFDKKSRLESYDKAYRFYKKYFRDEVPVFACESWLLFPKNREILGENSNIVSFMDDFKIISSAEYPDNRNMWRIFGADAELSAAELPRKTSMQRALADWIQSGHRLGGGVGVFIYDTVKKTTVF